MSTVRIAIPRGADHYAIQVSQFIQWSHAASMEMMILEFTHKAPVNFENLFYFCGGYVDPRTHRYYACPSRMDALYPLFCIDDVMPDGSVIEAGRLVKALTLFTADRSDAFLPEFEEQGLFSVVTHPDLLPSLLAVVDNVAQTRRALHELFEQISHCRTHELLPNHMSMNFNAFCHSLEFAKCHWKEFVATWASVEVLGDYDSIMSRKMVALFDLVSYRKIAPTLDHSDYDLLREMHRQQLNGSLEEEIMIGELLGQEA